MDPQGLRMPRQSHISYANLFDLQCWNIEVPADRANMVLPPYWHSAWLTESLFPKDNQQAVYVGARRNAFFETQFLKKCFERKWGGPLDTFLLASPSPCHLPAPPNFNISIVPRPLCLPLESSSVDLIYCDDALNFLAPMEQQQLLSELLRVLRPSGRIALSVFLLLNAPATAVELTPYFPTPIHRPDIREILDSLGASYSYNASLFPGFENFNEDILVDQSDLLINPFSRIEGMPPALRGLSHLEIGISIFPTNT